MIFMLQNNGRWHLQKIEYRDIELEFQKREKTHKTHRKTKN